MIDRREFMMFATAALATAEVERLRALLAREAPRQPEWRARKRRVEVLGRTMAVLDTGAPTGTSSRVTLAFLHGNPTSSYLWRNIIPALSPSYRCVAPDLIGMGDSEKIEKGGADAYRFAEHARYLDALLDSLALGDQVVLVLHDWGGMLGFDWARRHAARVLGIAHMETVMDGLSSQTAPPAVIDWFRRYRSDSGERMVLRDNQFVEQVLLAGLVSALTDADRVEYRRPFAREGEDRRPTLVWPREMPIDGDPADVASRFDAARAFLAGSPISKLFINVEPGALVASPARKAICRSWPNTKEVTVRGGHFVQEESPGAISAALREWLTGIA